MIAPDVQAAFHQLQQALGLSMVCGQLVLNVNNGELQSIEKVREFVRVPSAKDVDKREAVRA